MPLTRPENLDLTNRAALDEWLAQIRQENVTLAEAAREGTLTPEQVAYVNQLADWAEEAQGAYTALGTSTTDAEHQQAALDRLNAATSEPAPEPASDGDDDGGSGEPAPQTVAPDAAAAVVASAEAVLDAILTAASTRAPAPDPDDNGGGGGAAPSVADLIGAGANSGGEGVESPLPAMVAAADVGGGYTSGQSLTDRAMLAGAVQARLKGYGLPATRTGNGPVIKQPNKRLPTSQLAAVDTRQVGGRFVRAGRLARLNSPQRHSAAQIFREVGEESQQFGADAEANWAIAQAASSEWAARLAAGRSEAARGMVEREALIASWCAMSDPVYNLCSQTSLDGMLPLPERAVNRGGVIMAADGGYDFGAIYDAIGDNTATDAELTEGVTKECVEVPCLEAEDERLNADWLCITASILQRRAWPESVEAFIDMAIAAKFHKTNSRIIQAIVDGSEDAGTILGCTGEGAFEALYSGVEVAVKDMATRAYMSMGGEWEVVLPWWVEAQVRSSVMRRRAIDDPIKANAWMQQQFAKLGVTVHWVYGWQDAHIDPVTPGLPGGATPLTALPTLTSFAIYPAGTWVKGFAPVIDLDTIYDSALLAENRYTALFVEDGWLALKMCPYSRVYEVVIDPCGCGCDGDTSSPVA